MCDTICIVDRESRPHWTLSFLSTNYCLTRFTCILFLLLEYICFSINLFCVLHVFLLSASQQCINPTLLPWAGCDTRSIFNWSLAGLNSEFSFLKTDYQTKPDILFTHSWEKKRWHGHKMKCKQPHPGFELRSSIPFLTMITVKLSLPYFLLYI